MKMEGGTSVSSRYDDAAIASARRLWTIGCVMVVMVMEVGLDF
jgi:hypothetical protein